MTYLNMPRFGGNKNNATETHDTPRARTHNQSFSRGGNNQRRAPARTSQSLATPADPVMVAEIETMVAEGRQKDLVQFFHGWSRVPSRVGEWELRVNIRRQDEVEVGRTIVALPLTVRAREVFEKGCLATLISAGYSDDDSQRYYKAAWKKKYVWVDSVIAATKEMIDAFKTSDPLENFELSGDPRNLARSVGVPKNPYLTSHSHFLVAIDMAKGIIKARQKDALKNGEDLLNDAASEELDGSAV